MGYSTTFNGEFDLDKPLDNDTYALLHGLSQTRRMKRDLTKIMSKQEAEKYGTDGEFYVDSESFEADLKDPSVVEINHPPAEQPGLWCQWTPSKDRKHIVWDGGEKFYEYVKWIAYIIDRILKPRGYILNGTVEWQGDDSDDIGRIVVTDNTVKTQSAVISWKDNQ